jgi:hypothetical protein
MTVSRRWLVAAPLAAQTAADNLANAVARADAAALPYLALDLRATLLMLWHLSSPDLDQRQIARRTLTDRFNLTGGTVEVLAAIAETLASIGLAPPPKDPAAIQKTPPAPWESNAPAAASLASPAQLRRLAQVIEARRDEFTPRQRADLSYILVRYYYPAFPDRKSGVPSHISATPPADPARFRHAGIRPYRAWVRFLRDRFAWPLHYEEPNDPPQPSPLELSFTESPDFFLALPDRPLLESSLQGSSFLYEAHARAGRVTTADSPLNEVISLPSETRSLYDLIAAIRREAGRAAGIRIEQGPGPLSILIRSETRVGFQGVRAADVLLAILRRIPQPLVWDLVWRENEQVFSLGFERLSLRFRDLWTGGETRRWVDPIP